MGTALIAVGVADIVFVVAGTLVAIVVLAASPLTRRGADARERATKVDRRADVDKQFKRPGNEGDLL